MSIINKLFGDKQTKEADKSVDVCVFDSAVQPFVDYTEKFSRAEKVTYRGIGSTRYASGMPPSIYDSAISAIQSFPSVYGCVTAISEAVASMGIKIYQVNGGVKEEVLDHPFYQIFKNPNPFQGSFEFLEEMQQNLDIMGNNFIGIEKVAGGIELYNLSPKYVSVIPDPKVRVKEYHYWVNGNIIKYKPEEMIHIMYANIDDPYYGMPPLNAVASVLTLEKSRVAYANKFFDNGAIPAGVLEADSNIGDSMLRKLRSEWSNVHLGTSNSHKVAILQGGLKYKSIASPLKDLDFNALKKLTREDILTVYKVPESVLGDLGGTGSAEGKAALTAFWRGSIVPRLKRIESALNRGLAIDMFGQGNFVFEFNLKDVVALQEDKAEQAKYLQEVVGASILTPNECRAMLGYPRSEDPYADSLLVSQSFFGNQMLPADAAAAASAANGVQTAGDNKPALASRPAPAAPGGAPPMAASKPTTKPVAKPSAKPAQKPKGKN